MKVNLNLNIIPDLYIWRQKSWSWCSNLQQKAGSPTLCNVGHGRKMLKPITTKVHNSKITFNVAGHHLAKISTCRMPLRLVDLLIWPH